MKSSYFIFLLISLFLATAAKPCTTFVLKDKNDNIVFGRNFDFPTGMGHVIINKRNQSKTAFIRPPEIPFTWTSKFGSITFNQNGKEFPYGGMNEAGLVVEQMWLQEAQYPPQDDRHGLTELQWIQYQLDCSATVADVIESNQNLRVSFTSVATLHFLVADKTGDVATIEYLDGKMVLHRGADLPYAVLANCPYDVSNEYKQNRDANTEKAYTNWIENSSGRFTTAAHMIDEWNGAEPGIEDYAFSILDAVAQENSTQWSIVYNINSQTIAWKTNSNQKIRALQLDHFDFSCESADLYIEIEQTPASPDDFRVFSYDTNYELIEGVCNAVEFLKNSVPPEARIAIAHYPESVICSEKHW
ncbi:MAG: linear amide C-N hydrolase [Bacteroidetes bacterium]|nr:linear amide C-N hydrolase [Bacteroidota bacterium]